MKLEINHIRKMGKETNTWRLNNMLLKNQWVNNEIREIRKYLETNKNENTTLQSLWNPVKAVLRERFIAIQAFLKKNEKHQINSVTYHVK